MTPHPPSKRASHHTHNPSQKLLRHAVRVSISSFTPDVHPDLSDQSITQILQEIQTLECIANWLNYLYSLGDRINCRGSQKQ